MARTSSSGGRMPIWPPDLYAIAGALLKRSEAYLRVFEHDGSSGYLVDVERVGGTWLKGLDQLPQPISIARLRAARPRQIDRSWPLTRTTIQRRVFARRHSYSAASLSLGKMQTSKSCGGGPSRQKWPSSPVGSLSHQTCAHKNARGNARHTPPASFRKWKSHSSWAGI